VARRAATLVLGIVMTAVITASATAQTAVQEVTARRSLDRATAPQPLPEARVRFTSQRAPANADQIRFTLNGVTLVGATAFDADALSALYAQDIGREITLTQVFGVAAALQDAYRAEDMIFTRVIVPAQEIIDGVVRLEVIEARIDDIVLEEPEGPVGPVRALARRMVAALIGVDNPTGAQIERAILNINELPGVTRATIVPQPTGGASRGGLTLYLNIERDPFEAVLYADNRQTPAIGRNVAGATVTLKSYSAAADTTSLSIFNSFDVFSDRVPETGAVDGPGDFDERTTLYAQHQRAVGTDGATVAVKGLYSRTRLGDDLASVGVTGDQVFASAELSYPIIRSRSREVGVSAQFDYLDSETDISNGRLRISDDRIRAAAVSLSGLQRDARGYTSFNATVRQGLDILDATQSDDLERSRFDGEAVFTLIRGEAERQVALDGAFDIFARVGAQYAFDPLLAAEEFAIGGLSYGRGFDPSEFTGEHGVGASAELRRNWRLDLMGVQLSLQGYGFADYGVIWNVKDGEPKREDLFSAGGGVRFYLPQDAFVEAEIAVPIDQPLTRVNSDGEQISGARFFLTLSKRF